MAIIRQQAAFAANKLVQIVALGLLYVLIPVSIFKQIQNVSVICRLTFTTRTD